MKKGKKRTRDNKLFEKRVKEAKYIDISPCIYCKGTKCVCTGEECEKQKDCYVSVLLLPFINDSRRIHKINTSYNEII